MLSWRSTSPPPRSDVGSNVDEAALRVAGRPISDTERDGLWAVVSMQVYQLLVEVAGWTPARYEDWMADTIGRLLRPGKGMS